MVAKIHRLEAINPKTAPNGSGPKLQENPANSPPILTALPENTNKATRQLKNTTGTKK